jgi:hypothetical protein
MKPILPTITGIGSVTPFGPLAGLIPLSIVEPSPITAWSTDGLRRAFLVKPFQPASIVPGLKTRRLDRLSAWALVTASLALQDAGIDLSQVDRSRVAVVLATSFGCIESTESFYQSAFRNGWQGTDPITFPETLANSPAGHVALFHGLQGPNITVSSKTFAGENALLQAASLLRNRQADLAVVISGDALTRTMYEWYETANVLSPACFNADTQPEAGGYVPSEGIVAMVLEPEGKRSVRSYAHLQTGCWACGGEALKSVRRMLDGSVPNLIIGAGDGGPCATGSSNGAIDTLAADGAAILPVQPVALGVTDAGALFHLALALSTRPSRGPALMLATAADGGFAALLLELP